MIPAWGFWTLYAVVALSGMEWFYWKQIYKPELSFMEKAYGKLLSFWPGSFFGLLIVGSVALIQYILVSLPADEVRALWVAFSWLFGGVALFVAFIFGLTWVNTLFEPKQGGRR